MNPCRVLIKSSKTRERQHDLVTATNYTNYLKTSFPQQKGVVSNAPRTSDKQFIPKSSHRWKLLEGRKPYNKLLYSKEGIEENRF